MGTSALLGPPIKEDAADAAEDFVPPDDGDDDDDQIDDDDDDDDDDDEEEEEPVAVSKSYIIGRFVYSISDMFENQVWSCNCSYSHTS